MTKPPFLLPASSPAMMRLVSLCISLTVLTGSASGLVSGSDFNFHNNNLRQRRRHLIGGGDNRRYKSSPQKGDRINFLVVRPECTVTCIGIDYSTGRTGFRIDCPPDDYNGGGMDEDDDIFSNVDGGDGDDIFSNVGDDDMFDDQIASDDDDVDEGGGGAGGGGGGILLPSDDDDAGVVDDFFNDDDINNEEEYYDINGNVPGSSYDPGDTRPTPPAPTPVRPPVPPPVLPPTGTQPVATPSTTPLYVGDDDAASTTSGDQDDNFGSDTGEEDDDYVTMHEDENNSAVAGGGDDDEEYIVNSAETDSISQENKADDDGSAISQAGVILLGLAGVLFIVMIFCCFLGGGNKKSNKLDDDDDTKKLLGEDIEEANKNFSPYRDYDDKEEGGGGEGYHPPRRLAGAWGFGDDFEDEGQFGDYLKSLQNYKSQNGNCLVPPYYRDEDDRPLGRWVTLQRHLAAAGELSQNKIERLTALGFVWALQDGDGRPEDHGIVTDPKVWGGYLQSLKAYRNNHGDCDVPYDYRDAEGRALGKWVHRQRNRASRGSLPLTQQRQLDAIGFNWDAPTGRRSSGVYFGDSGLFDLEDDSLWEEYVQCLTNYKSQYGDCLVPKNYRDPEDRPLGQWVTLQRHLAAAHELSDHKIDQLTLLGFVWKLQEGDGTAEYHGIVTDPNVWQQYLQALSAYKKKHGDCNVPFGYRDSEGRTLGKWVHRQRHRAERGSLPQTQKMELDALGFDWKISGRRSSNARLSGSLPRQRSSLLQRLFSSKKSLGDNEKSLGDSKLIASLNALPYHDLEDENLWDEYVQLLADFKSQHGDCFVPSNYRDQEGRPLGQWVTLQRHLAAADELSENKIDQLTGLGFIWELQDGDGRPEDHGIVQDPKVWYEYLQALEAYRNQHGNCDVPIDYRDAEGRALGKWVHHQRNRSVRGSLPQDQKIALDALGLNWEVSSHRSSSVRFRGSQSHRSSRVSFSGSQPSRRRSSLLKRIFISKKSLGDNEKSLEGSKYIDAIYSASPQPYHDLEDDNLWDEYVQSLVDFKSQHGDCFVPPNYRDPEGRALGQWITLQRHLAEAGEISQDKIDQLTGLGFIWEIQDGDGNAEDHGIVTDPRVWDQYLESLKAYKTDNGDCRVPFYYVDAEGRSVGKWVHRQRHRARRGSLTRDQRKELDDLDFDWDVSLGRSSGAYGGYEAFVDLEDDVLWDEYLVSLATYKAEHGDCLVPPNYKDLAGRPLGQWVTLQRHLSAAGELPRNKIDQLTKLGFMWQLQDGDGIAEDHGIVRDPKVWDQYLASLAEYQMMHGNCDVPYSYRDYEGRALGYWVQRQRHRYKRGTLSKKQKSRLDALGFNWAGGDEADSQIMTSTLSSRSTLLQRMFSSKRKGINHSNNGVGEFYCDYFGLNGDDQWEEYVSALKDYRSIHGDCNVPRLYFQDENGASIGHGGSGSGHGHGYAGEGGGGGGGSGRPLGEWVSYQRVRNAGNKMPPHRFEELDSLGFIWDLQEEDDNYRYGPTLSDVVEDWESYLAALTKYKNVHGDCMVPYDYKDKSSTNTNKKKSKNSAKDDADSGIGIGGSGRPSLGVWVSNVRDVAAQNELPPLKRYQLNELGFDWETHRGDGYGLSGGCGYGRWEEYFDALVDYKMDHGDCRVPLNYTDKYGLELGAWVANQRHRADQDELPYKNHDRLTGLGFDWETIHGGTEPEEVWDRHILSIRDYKANFGSTDTIPWTFEDWKGVGLGSWCINQSDKASQGKLHPTLKNELTSVGVDLRRFQNVGGNSLKRAVSQKVNQPAYVYDEPNSIFEDEHEEEEGKIRSRGGPAGRYTPQMNVHRCVSAVCDACKVHGQESVTFLNTKHIT